ncbi:cupin domain-containing protein [Natrarchaeobius halalkaliphilus]|uniref:Cupin domain-containing protein n=1 Tax=Natrarchaeobius halalkaliphilus TaxID=1679091 RepID=A0A3N6NWM5_9EURY|nr:cupin domain-containing protein [Natrarchaeobius halalkaliphilus]RQG88959.1 cupin domain-containing protein [Natrarchaeobius halalkaliphilus]
MSEEIIKSESTTEHLHVLGATITITADSDDTDGEFSVKNMLAPPGFENGLHTHEPAEVFHVIDGEMLLYVDGETQYLKPGMTGYVSAGERHGMRVEGDEVLRVLIVMSPAGAEDFFRAVGEPAADRNLPEPREVTNADLEAIFATGEEHGFEFFGPLPADE